MPDKRRLVTSKVCFGSEKAGLLENSYNKCALTRIKIERVCFYVDWGKLLSSVIFKIVELNSTQELLNWLNLL